jgi:hypothetical protein
MIRELLSEFLTSHDIEPTVNGLMKKDPKIEVEVWTNLKTKNYYNYGCQRFISTHKIERRYQTK